MNAEESKEQSDEEFMRQQRERFDALMQSLPLILPAEERELVGTASTL